MKIVKPVTLTLNTCSVTEKDAVDGVVWSSGTIYAKDKLVRYEHVTYKSLDDNNHGNIPSDTYSGLDAKWQKIGATMPYRMLDDYVETATEAAAGATLTASVDFTRSDSIALLNIKGVSATISITDLSNSSVVFSKTVSLLEDIDSLSLYEYYFSPVTGSDIYVNTEIPMTISGRLSVSIVPGSSGSVASIGHIVVGRKQEIGETKYGAEMGITDYSRKNTDEFGVTTLVKRSFSKNASLSLFIPPNRANKVTTILSSVTATPILIEGGNADTGYEALTIYGWLEDWRQVYQGPNENELRLEIQGLI